MLLDGLGWSHYSVFAPCIMTQTRVLGRSGEGVMLHRGMKTFQLFMPRCEFIKNYITGVNRFANHPTKRFHAERFLYSSRVRIVLFFLSS